MKTTHKGDEAYLTRAAEEVLRTEVLGAGIFASLEADMVGLAGGGALGGMAAGGLADLGVGGAVVGAVGTMAAIKGGQTATADAQGTTFNLLVAVTADRVVVMDWRRGEAGEVVRDMDRATTEVHAHKLGLALFLTLHPGDGSPSVNLKGSVSHGFKQSGPDKVVLHLLTDGA